MILKLAHVKLSKWRVSQLFRLFEDCPLLTWARSSIFNQWRSFLLIYCSYRGFHVELIETWLYSPEFCLEYTLFTSGWWLTLNMPISICRWIVKSQSPGTLFLILTRRRTAYFFYSHCFFLFQGHAICINQTFVGVWTLWNFSLTWYPNLQSSQVNWSFPWRSSRQRGNRSQPSSLGCRLTHWMKLIFPRKIIIYTNYHIVCSKFRSNMIMFS